MINKWNDWLQKIKNSDLFHRTQWRLTALYSGILMVFLTLFIAIAAFLFYLVATNDQERRIINLVNQEQKAVEQFLLKQSDFDFFDEESVVLLNEDQFFFYVVGTDGQLIAGDEVNKYMRPFLLKALQESRINEHVPTYVTVDIPKQLAAFTRLHSHELRLLTAARPVVLHGNVIGILYVGVDVTSFFNIFRWLLVVLIGLAILFIGVAVVLSYFMSKRALIPIQEAYDRQRQFVADASHELRTPLSVIFSSVEALAMEEEVTKNEFAHKLLTRLREELKRMTKLINDLLTLARADAKHASLQLVKETFDFRPYAERTLQLLSELAAKKQIQMHLHAPESIIITADADKLTQLLYILLDNAIKYTPDHGEVSLSLRLEPWKQQKRLTISVKDTGIGIPPEAIHRIFDRFYRVDKARSRQQGGHGLGLSIAKWIVDAHGGTIDVQSEVGKGSEFIVKIPC
ncbi:GHKL domain-containing protein [Parageobacillus sp. VR-IP]|uniref:sensor histidine kinase n=1 Tax=Parageobacillus sp. VR-IP TaxID=2742205 RepID=UPI0015828341|nr:ATP-binding protein [Parageobacillus sp. VR-IP]NUK31778.1 GHKL domain-containing protein [Parageobacillus sp. VR-IP]